MSCAAEKTFQPGLSGVRLAKTICAGTATSASSVTVAKSCRAPRIQALRAELVEGLERGRPAAVVVLRDSWLERGYDRLDRFPELGSLLARDYALAVTGDDYRIYAKRSGS